MRKVDKLLVLLTEFGCDRWVHIVVCLVVAWLIATLAMVGMVMLQASHTERAITGLIGVAGGLFLSVCKEIYDYKTEGLFDKTDVAADCIGLALFYVIYTI